MNSLLRHLNKLESYQTLAAAVISGRTPVYAAGAIDSQKCHLCAALIEQLGKSSVIIASSELKAKEIYDDMRFFMRDAAKFYPAKDIIFYSADLKSTEITKERFSVIKSILDNEKICVVLSADALLDRLPPAGEFRKFILKLHRGNAVDISELSKKLVYMGYERVDLVEAPGHFAIRGGIVDVYTTVYDYALRLDLFGDEVESIKLLDTYSQRSIEVLDEAIIYPMRELVYDEDRLNAAIEKISEESRSAYKLAVKNNRDEEAAQIISHSDEITEKLKMERAFTGADEYITYFYPESVSLFDYLPEDSLVFFDEPSKVIQHLETVLQEFTQSMHHRMLRGAMLPSQTEMVFTSGHILSRALRFRSVLMASMAGSVRDVMIKEIVKFSVKSSPVFQFASLSEDLKRWRDGGYSVAILAGAKFQAQRLADEVVQLGFSATFTEDLSDQSLEPGLMAITRGHLKSGFEYPDAKLAVITMASTGEDKKKKRRSRQKGTQIESFTDLRVGDYVVHDNHGIGVYEGIEQITIDNVRRDYLKLVYADGGRLYIQTNQMDLIQKYIGGDASKAKLNKLGGSEWSKAKSRARKAVAILAKDLVALYAKRETSKGFQYSKDTIWQKEFEDLFMFEETEDQLLAIEDVKRDMESGKVMDRLICGDVGYGKTEVAIRAAFKTIQDGKQVAYLVPTTILAQQHFNTFKARMETFPIDVEMLSRFKTQSQQRETLERLKEGTCDVVIGTHRLLSRDLVFRSLGLIIVDEEQRFGVSHKERLKALKENVNVLTLTATPIPRTLHMSLSGIRDMSILEEPPQERQPIQTYVMEYNPEFVKDAITREIARGGQVYYLHNRVHNIVEEADRVARLVPEAKVAFAHGRMSERELEKIMLEFISGDLQVLVCTTIIETGLDISNVNTIVIQDADYMGLSQLYQLRGRVGRSNRLAYAYLMYRKDKVLPEVAEKRLQTIREFTEFGSGFKIAMRDLEIRGAGNLLGSEQHGHMDLIGYDMYCKLLAEAISDLRGEPKKEEFETFIDAPINAFIPQDFISNEEQKLEIYKKVSLISNEREQSDIREEIQDRYGQIPRAVDNLLFIALLKAQAHDMGVLSIMQKGRSIVITFKGDSKVDPVKLTGVVKAFRQRLMFTQAPNPYLTYKMLDDDIMTSLGQVKKLIKELGAKEDAAVFS
ncbi:MAG: transcription-repair coupling factor [Clostridiales bacterium]|jgi:transcription-repair coupling factor (superfamily II helicase)|nr:transcription-repair coupling factor [Clostridiales bacterium]